MKLVLLLTLIICSTCVFSQNNPTGAKAIIDTQRANSGSKPVYEMKQYFFVMLTKGSRRAEITDTAVINNIQAGHIKNIERLAALGKIIVAGPFGDDGNWRGIFIFNAATKEEVEALLSTDPAIAAGRLAYEIHPWWTAKNCTFK